MLLNYSNKEQLIIYYYVFPLGKSNQSYISLTSSNVGMLQYMKNSFGKTSLCVYLIQNPLDFK